MFTDLMALTPLRYTWPTEPGFAFLVTGLSNELANRIRRLAKWTPSTF